MDILESVRQEILKLVPSSLLNEIACFVFYDNHPRDDKTIDIIICTNNGELKEFYQRDLINSLYLNSTSKPTDIKIHRNSNSELFYPVLTTNELFIISSKDQLQIHKNLTNIDRYEINDTECSGKTCLKVIKRDDAVPIFLNDNFESLEDQNIFTKTQNDDNYFPILTELRRKLVEAKYITKCNEKTYLQYISLRQKASLHSYMKIHPNTSTSTLNDDLNSVVGALRLKSQKPWIKVCNKQIVIMLNVISHYKEPLENIHILLNTMDTSSVMYTTKSFSKLPNLPYWKETQCNKLKENQEYAIIAIINLKEIKMNVTSRIKLRGYISYKMYGNENLLPFEDVVISSSESMGDEFDVLSNVESTGQNCHNTILAILATTVKTELVLRHIKNDDTDVSLLDLFCKHLQMERVGDCHNVIVYRKSPYHVLNGTMVVFGDDLFKKSVAATLYTRSQSQVLAFLHCIYDAVPAKIIATTPTYKITSKTDQLSPYNEEIIDTPQETKFTEYATSILNRSTKVLEYLDKCMIKMCESKNPEICDKVGSCIDLFADGVEDFKAFKRSVLEETRKGIDLLDNLDSTNINMDNDVMIVD